MDQATHNRIVSFLWGIADDVLRDLFKRGKYPDVILPMAVIRRLDAVLEPSKARVLEAKQSWMPQRSRSRRRRCGQRRGSRFTTSHRLCCAISQSGAANRNCGPISRPTLKASATTCRIYWRTSSSGTISPLCRARIPSAP